MPFSTTANLPQAISFPFFRSHLELAHRYWKELLIPGDCVIDATCGTGQDTYFLAKLLQGKGKISSYDIQSQALEKAALLFTTLSKEEKKIIELKLKSHVFFEENHVKLIVYNLGYLPGGDKSLTTKTSSTLESLHRAMQIVIPGGAISVTCYPGHPEGALEEAALIDFLSKQMDEWNVCHHRWFKKGAPSLILLQRRQLVA